MTIVMRTIDKRNAGYRVSQEQYDDARRGFVEDPANKGKNPAEHIHPVGTFMQSFDQYGRKVQVDEPAYHHFNGSSIPHAVNRALRYLRSGRSPADAPGHIKLAIGVFQAVTRQAAKLASA